MPYIGVSPQFGVRRKHTYTATAGQTSFSGAGSEGATLSYKDSNFVDVYQNGVKLGDADYTSTSGTAIVLAQGASVDDLIEIIVFDAFSAADTVSKADGGTFDGNITMGGTLDVTGNGTVGGTLGVTGVLTANAGIKVDNITIDGTEIDLSSGDLTLDVAGNIILDADGGVVRFYDGGTQIGNFANNSSEFHINVSVQDKDFVINGNDGGSTIEAFRIDMSEGGRVGIGEASPDTPLHITYTKDVAYSADNFTQEAQTGLKIENTSSTGNAFSSMQFRIGGGADMFFGAEQKSGNDGDFVFGNQNSTDIEMARITNRPCLVVGSSSDTDARIFGTRGDAGSTGFFESTSSATSGVRAISTSLNQNSNNGNCHHLRSTTQNVATYGLLGNGSSTFSSDERLKKNIETTRDGYLEDLAKLRVVKYNWHCDDDSTDKELGLIAQEVQKVFPRLVVEDDVELNGIKNPLALKVSVLPTMLLKALQEANTKITALETENATQATQIADLISRVTALEKGE